MAVFVVGNAYYILVITGEREHAAQWYITTMKQRPTICIAVRKSLCIVCMNFESKLSLNCCWVAGTFQMPCPKY